MFRLRMLNLVAGDIAAGGMVSRVSEPKYDRAVLLGALFDQNYISLRRLAFAIVGDASAAEDIAQEAFVRLYSSWRRLDHLGHPPSYLRKIVVNLCRSRARRLRLQQKFAPLLRSSELVNDPDVAERIDVWTALQKLPERQRACAVLRYLEDLTESEIADILECSLGTVKSQLHKARAKLGSSLQQGEGDEQ